jgi:hypothetical protein
VAARRNNFTVRQLMHELAGGGGHRVIVGTPEQIADDIEHWFKGGAADGFNLMPDALPDGLQDFVSGVVPILQKRGICSHRVRGAHFARSPGVGAAWRAGGRSGSRLDVFLPPPLGEGWGGGTRPLRMHGFCKRR